MFRTKALTAIVTSVAVCLTSLSFAYAAQEFKISKDEMRNSSLVAPPVISNTGGNNTFSLDVKKENPSIGMNTVYGTSQRGTTYMGEVPAGKKEIADDFKDKPKLTNSEIGGVERKWYKDPSSISDKIKWEKDKAQDIHAMNLSDKNRNIMDGILNFLSSGGFLLLSGLNALVGNIVRLFITIATFDIGEVATLDPMGVGEIVTKVVLGEPGQMSPVLILALVMFLIGLAANAVKWMRTGTMSLKTIIQKVGILMLAMCLCGVAWTGGYERILNTATQFALKATSSISTDMGAKLRLFSYDTGVPARDAGDTLNGLTTKPFIDSVVRSQFGYEVNQLDLYGDNVDTQKLWGIDAGKMREIVKKVSDKGDLVNVSVGGGNNNSEAPNLGYFWYAACSGVDNINPINVKGGVATQNYAPQDRTLFVIDILSAIDAEAGGSAKAQSIMNNFKGHGYDWFSMAMMFFVTIALAYALSLTALLALVTKLIFSIGFIFIPFIPIFLLIEKLRPLAEKAVNTWVNSALKMIMCQAIVLMLIYMSAVFCSSGSFTGYITDMAFLIVFGKYGPKILARLNRSIDRSRPQFQFADNVSRGFNNAAEAYAGRSFKENNERFNEMRNKIRQDEAPSGAQLDTSNDPDLIADNIQNSVEVDEMRHASIGGENGDTALSNFSANLKDCTPEEKEEKEKEFLHYRGIFTKKYNDVNEKKDSEFLKDLMSEKDLERFKKVEAEKRKLDAEVNARLDIATHKRDRFNDFLEKPLVKAFAETNLGSDIVMKAYELNKKRYEKAVKNNGFKFYEFKKKSNAQQVNKEWNKARNIKVKVNGQEVCASQAAEYKRNKERDMLKNEFARDVRRIIHSKPAQTAQAQPTQVQPSRMQKPKIRLKSPKIRREEQD